MTNGGKLCLVIILTGGMGLICGRANPVSILPYSVDVTSGPDGADVNITFNMDALKQFPIQGSAGGFEYQSGNIPLQDSSGRSIGSIDHLGIGFFGDPSVAITFVATAGSLPTTFTITSAIVSFPALVNPTGQASAEMTLTDVGADGASITPGFGPAAYEALYNGGGSVFAALIGSQSLSSGGSLSVSESTGASVIPGSVTDIQGAFRFTLSAGDTASGGGLFEVTSGGVAVPESGGTISLLVLSSLALQIVGRQARFSWRARRAVLGQPAHVGLSYRITYQS